MINTLKQMNPAPRIHSTKCEVRTAVQILEQKGIHHAVISSGSRNAPLAIELSHSGIECHSVIDERCAAFFALGIARETGTPVALACTSGTAVLDYYPAVAEAFYSRVPLIVLSADRPAEWVDQAIGQTIRQDGVLAAHTVYHTVLREGDDRQTTWYNAREICNAVDAAFAQSAPVHINIPLSEPLYDTVEGDFPLPKIISDLPTAPTLTEQGLGILTDIWKQGKRKMILVGCHARDERFEALLEDVSRAGDAIVLCESTSNLRSEDFILHIDRLIIPLSAAEASTLYPDVLITCAGMVVSKKIKNFLKTAAPAEHLHVNRYTFPDTFTALNRRVPMDEKDFFGLLSQVRTPATGYVKAWHALREKRAEAHERYCAQTPYSDFKAWELLIRSIPDDSHLEIANSAAVRYSQLFPLPRKLTVGCNRGTSGIDGSSSTAVGAAVALAPRQVTLMTGDLSFFYDNNAFWNHHLPPSFRIVLLNNGGGGIFRILDGARHSDICTDYLQAVHTMDARGVAQTHSLLYDAAHDLRELEEKLPRFWEASPRPKLLEVFTTGIPNDEILRNYFREKNGNK